LITRHKLEEIIIEYLEMNKKRASLLEISQYIWEKYENHLRESGKIFYTWQYDLRWAANSLRRKGVIKSGLRKGLWELVGFDKKSK